VSPVRPDADPSILTFVSTMTFKPEHEQEFLDLALPFVAKVRALEPDTLLYVLARHPTEPHTFVWIERYPSQAAFTAHKNTPYMKEAFPIVLGWLAKPLVSWRLEEVVAP
jgi:quinol monooxygenase YgiN